MSDEADPPDDPNRIIKAKSEAENTAAGVPEGTIAPIADASTTSGVGEEAEAETVAIPDDVSVSAVEVPAGSSALVNTVSLSGDEESGKLFDLEWQHEQLKAAKNSLHEDSTSQPQAQTSAQAHSAQETQSGLGSTLLAEQRAKDPLQSVDQSVNLNSAFDQEGESSASSMDSSPTTNSRASQAMSRSHRSVRSAGTGVPSRKTFSAPVRPSKYMSRPSQVHVKRNVTNDELATSLMGVVEGRISFNRRKRTFDPTNAASTTTASSENSKNSELLGDKTKQKLVALVKLVVVAAFLVYGVFVIVSFSAPGSMQTDTASTSTSSTFASRDGAVTWYTKPIQPYQEQQRVGDTVNVHVVPHSSKNGESGTDDDSEIKVHLSQRPRTTTKPTTTTTTTIITTTKLPANTRSGEVPISVQDNGINTFADQIAGGNDKDVQVHVSQHYSNIHSLEKMLLNHQISLPSLLNYSRYVTNIRNTPQPNAQVRTLLWLSQSHHSDNLRLNDEQLIQRYALGVLYFSLSGDYRSDASTINSQRERNVHILQQEQEQEQQSDRVATENTIAVYQGWKRKAKWMTRTSVCQWYGIHCENDMVTSLNLTQNRLLGAIPVMELFHGLRTTLKSLDLSHNEITGHLDDISDIVALEKWTQLEYFYVNSNSLRGNPPIGWFDLSLNSTIVAINLAHNNFGGKLQEMSSLQTLKALYVSHNALSNDLPNFSHLSNLEILHLNSNKFTGTVPPLPSSLVDLNVGHNFLEGSIPLTLPLLSNLEALHWDHCNMTGHIPDFFNSFTSLTTLDLSFNAISGPLPLSLGNATKIEQVLLNDNSLTGEFPTDYVALTRLGSLRLENNNMYGSVPIDICRLKAGLFHFKYLDELTVDCLHQMICDCCDECF